MAKSSSTNHDRSQERIIHEVFECRGYGVELRIRDFPEFCAHEFNRAIYNLRWRDDLNIPKPRMESVVVDGRRLTISYYRLLPGKWSERETESAPPSSTRQERIERFEREFRPAAVVPTVSTTDDSLPLFAGVRR